MSQDLSQRTKVVEVALSWLGTPYHHQGRVKSGGVDCGQFIAAVFEEAGLAPHVQPKDYPPDWYMHRDEDVFLKLVETYAKKVERPAIPGDIILYKYGRTISHAAIVVNWPIIIHSKIGIGVILDEAVGNKELESRQQGIWSVEG